MKRILWGKVAGFVLCVGTAMVVPAQTLTTLYRFHGADGATPDAGLVQSTSGDLYGTTADGGARGKGTVFKISPGGSLTTLYSFCARSACTDGETPGGLIQATNGYFYGTTSKGGANRSGTVFRMTPGGVLTTLYSFCSQSGCADGQDPFGPLVQATDGNLYGTTYGNAAGGTIFKITPSGTLTTLYSFAASGGGSGPTGLVQAYSGNFYGTTQAGGASGLGTVFQFTRGGTLTTLYSFCSLSGCADGTQPNGLVQAIDGDLYGTTVYGGTTCSAPGCGTVFRITPRGTLTTIYSFCSQAGCPDGAEPVAPLIQATDSNFYGTTIVGGANCPALYGCGTAFKITANGALTTLYNFCSDSKCADGANPYPAIVQATNGDLYGETYAHGDGYGTIFSLPVGLGPFVETEANSGKVGAAVKVLGTGLTGASSVSFNGTAAVFQVISSSLITTTVPAGASTGKVEVVTPNGTLTSNLVFRVRP